MYFEMMYSSAVQSERRNKSVSSMTNDDSLGSLVLSAYLIWASVSPWELRTVRLHWKDNDVLPAVITSSNGICLYKRKRLCSTLMSAHWPQPEPPLFCVASRRYIWWDPTLYRLQLVHTAPLTAHAHWLLPVLDQRALPANQGPCLPSNKYSQ